MKSYSYNEFAKASLDLSKTYCYLITGSDSYLGDCAQRHIREQARNFHTAELIYLYGEETTAPELSEHLDSYSLFSERKVILLKNCDKLKKDALDTLAAYYSSISDTQILIVFTPKVDVRFSAWKKIREASLCVECNPPRFAGDVRAWFDQQLAKNKKYMDYKAKDEFLSRIELDYAAIDNELQKLILLTYDKNNISADDVARSLGTSRSGAMTDFYRALGRRDTKQSITQINKMLSSDNEPISIIFNLLRFMNHMWKINLLKSNHISESEIISSHLPDLFEKSRPEYVAFSKNFPLTRFPSIFSALLETDSRLKLTAAEPDVLLSLCILEILS
ncbi:MAG: DNA polymerase III subunit delta [Candidatus Cloacimonetes bacterium]|nr:DNA polymerase III subunit delta [Candidatus Cloacimonadota bacterium]